MKQKCVEKQPCASYAQVQLCNARKHCAAIMHMVAD